MWQARLGCQGVGSRVCQDKRRHDAHIRHSVVPAAAAPPKKGTMVATAPAQWGSSAKPAPATAKSPASAQAELKSAFKQSSKAPATQVVVEVEAGDGTRDLQMFTPTADQVSAAISTTFTVVLDVGQSNCAYIAVGVAIADASCADLGAPKLKPGGEIKPQLRRFTAKQIISNTERSPPAGSHEDYANYILGRGVRVQHEHGSARAASGGRAQDLGLGQHRSDCPTSAHGV